MLAVRSVLLAAVLLIVSLSAARGADAPQADAAHAASEVADRAVGSRLPPKLRALLIQEMQALLDASKQILDAMIRGQDELVARRAQGIQDSFILEQGMSDVDRQTFHDSVPHSFIERDQAFHALSERLVEAARAGDRPLQRKLFAEMVDDCVACHAAHATDRFPDLAARAR
jgi:hypothetical protein